jgi:hypothetical protein
MGKKLFSIMAVVMASTFALTACSSPAEDASTSAVSEVDRNALETEPKLVAITNNTGGDITLAITGTDNYDWEGSRPDHPAPEGFQGTLLAFGETQTRSLTMNRSAIGAPFTINFGETGASVELNTVNGCGTWTLRGGTTLSCRWKQSAGYTITSAGYTITVDSTWGASRWDSSPNTTVTITK